MLKSKFNLLSNTLIACMKRCKLWKDPWRVHQQKVKRGANASSDRLHLIEEVRGQVAVVDFRTCVLFSELQRNVSASKLSVDALHHISPISHIDRHHRGLLSFDRVGASKTSGQALPSTTQNSHVGYTNEGLTTT